VPRGGWDLTLWGTTVGTCRRGAWRKMYISRNFLFNHLFFENQSKINIKNPSSSKKENILPHCPLSSDLPEIVKLHEQECLKGKAHEN
jgi:hypothetical protein